MMSVLWFLIKIVLILLLILLGAMLAILLAVLLVPVRYRAEASFDGRLRADVRVSWLLHILSLHISYQEAADMSVRIFGYRLKGMGRSDGPGPEMEEYPPEEEDLMVSSQSASPEADGGGFAPEPSGTVDTPKRGQAEETIEAETEWGQAPKEYGPEQGQAREATDAGPGRGLAQERGAKAGRSRRRPRLKSPLAWLRGLVRRIRLAFRRLCLRWRRMENRLSRAKSWIKDPENQAMLRMIWKETRTFFRHILPRRGKGRLTVGFDDPYLTGQFLSAAGLLYPVLGDRIEIYPVFDHPALEGEFWVKGRIRALSVAMIGYRLWRNKNFRKIIRR